MEQEPRRKGLVGPLLLIGLGIVFLLNSLGMLDWGVWWTLLRLWPVLLIALGIELLVGRRSAWGSLAAVALIVLVFVAALALSIARTPALSVAADEHIAQPLQGATEARVLIQADAGKLDLKAAAESASLIEGDISASGGPQISHSYRVEGKKGIYTLSADKWQDNLYVLRGDVQRSWDLALNPEIPIDLEAALAVGEADLDLSGLRLSALKVGTAVSHARIRLPVEGNLKATFAGAIGEIEIIVPKGMAVRVDSSVALGSTNAPSSYARNDHIYTSPGYASAESKTDIKAALAIGRINIREE
jgi:hypothetical protein